MAQSKRRRRVRRVQGVKRDFLTLIDAVPLTKKGQQILKLLGAGNPASVVAKARLLMPLNVRRLEQRVSGVEEKVDKLSGEVHELVQVLKEALQPRTASSHPLKDGRYIT